MNRQLWLRQTLSAPNAEIPSQKNCTVKPQNRKLATPNPGRRQTKRRSQMQPAPLHESPLMLRLQPQHLEHVSQYGPRVMEHARHWLPGAVCLLQPMPGRLDSGRCHQRAALAARLPHFTVGDFILVGVSAAPPLHLAEATPS